MGSMINRFFFLRWILYSNIFTIYIIGCNSHSFSENNAIILTQTNLPQTQKLSLTPEILTTKQVALSLNNENEEYNKIIGSEGTILFIPIINASKLNRYIFQPGTPIAMINFAHPELDCNWLGVGGQVFNFSNQPIHNLIVEVGGSIEGNDIFLLGITGSASWIGPGGYELTILDHIATSENTLWIQVYDLNGEQLTSKIPFNTYLDCERNYILINFVENVNSFEYYLYFPLIQRN